MLFRSILALRDAAQNSQKHVRVYAIRSSAKAKGKGELIEWSERIAKCGGPPTSSQYVRISLHQVLPLRLPLPLPLRAIFLSII